MIRGQLRVLIVEDNPNDSWLVSERLAEAQSASFAVRIVRTLGAALEALREAPCDAVLLDLNLPDSSGLGTLEKMKEVCGAVPVIVVADVLDDRTIQEATQAGAVEVIGKDESNTRLFVRSVLHVIERSQAREEVRALECVLAAAPDALLVVGAGGRVLYVNDAALELFERERQDFVGELLSFSVADEAPTEVTIFRGQGGQRLCELRVRPIDWAREPAALAMMRDITERREMETRLAFSDRMVTIGTLAAGMAHEINNPLASLIANLDFALRYLPEDGPEAANQALLDAREGADRVRLIVRDLKIFSRFESEERRPVDVHCVIESAMRMAQVEVRNRAQVVRNFGELPPVEANEGRLGQVILNLLVNAAQAIPAGQVSQNEIRVSTEVDDQGDVVISVSDTGEGIQPDVQSRVFMAFFTTKPPGVGTGLGLAISQRIISALGGTLTFTTDVGKGSCFRVVLPASHRRLIVKSPISTAPPPQSAARILVVDDDAMVASGIKRILGEEQEVTIALGARPALDLIAAGRRFDVILCDMIMPEVSGRDFYLELQALGQGWTERIVFLNGGGLDPDLRRFVDSIPNLLLDKPFALDDLRRAVRKVAEGGSRMVLD